MIYIRQDEEGCLAVLIKDLERLHKEGNATYTDTFMLEELKARHATALRVHQGGGAKTLPIKPSLVMLITKEGA